MDWIDLRVIYIRVVVVLRDTGMGYIVMLDIVGMEIVGMNIVVSNLALVNTVFRHFCQSIHCFLFFSIDDKGSTFARSVGFNLFGGSGRV